jgi:hypothetical protein
MGETINVYRIFVGKLLIKIHMKMDRMCREYPEVGLKDADCVLKNLMEVA